LPGLADKLAMPITDILSDLGILPLRAIAFQSLLLMVAIALEATLLRQRLRLGYQTSMQYAATLNLLATSLGWLLFLTLESFLPADLRTQIISFVLFNRFYGNFWLDKVPVLVVGTGIACFFLTFWVKLQGLNLLLILLGQGSIAPDVEPDIESRKERYTMARQRQYGGQRGYSPYTLAVLEANALSFSAILVLLLLLQVAGVRQ
jgi:hypothetical protein